MPKRKPFESFQKRFSALIFLVLIFPLPELAFPIGSRLSDNFKTRVSRLLNQPKFDTGFWGVYVVSLKDQRILYSLNEKKRFLPASGMKLFVGAAALDKLGPAFQFETPVYAQGRVDAAGRLQGDLVLVGSGDPNLEGRIYSRWEENLATSASSVFVEQLADQIVAAGIKGVEGDVVGEDKVFLYEPYGISWEHDDLQWGYGAPASALAVNENIFSVEISPGEVLGDPAWIVSFPLPPGLKLVNRLGTTEKGHPLSIGIERSADGSHWIFQGNVPSCSDKLQYTLAVSDPAEYAALLLKAALEKRAIQVKGRAVARHLSPLDTLQNGKPSLERAKSLQPRYAPEQQVARWKSLPLVESIKIMMKVSHNLYAEMLLRKLGAESSGVGSIESGAAAVKSFMQKTGTSTEIWEQVNLGDGSGLSRVNQLTPTSIVRLLQHMHRHPHGQLFFQTLPVAGVDGTLKYRMQGTPAQGRVYAKTGTLGFVSTLSGYVVSGNDHKLAFSIMANNYAVSAQEVRAAIDEICVLMAKYVLGHPAEGRGKTNPGNKGKTGKRLH